MLLVALRVDSTSLLSWSKSYDDGGTTTAAELADGKLAMVRWQRRSARRRAAMAEQAFARGLLQEWSRFYPMALSGVTFLEASRDWPETCRQQMREGK
jgi:hypothetical protein